MANNNGSFFQLFLLFFQLVCRIIPLVYTIVMPCRTLYNIQAHQNTRFLLPVWTIFFSRNINNLLRECELHMETFELNAHITKSKSCGDKTYMSFFVYSYLQLFRLRRGKKAWMEKKLGNSHFESAVCIFCSTKFYDYMLNVSVESASFNWSSFFLSFFFFSLFNVGFYLSNLS